MSIGIKNIVTPDDLMEEFISDSVVSDDELSESIFTCVDNYIDDLCIEIMNDENSIFESDTDTDTPFTYILDKVMERIDTIENIDPDYCEGVDFDEITPEDFQLYIPTADTDVDDDDSYLIRKYDSGIFDDSNFNA